MKYNESKNSIKLKEEIDRCSKNIPLMFTVGIADGQTFSQMFKTMNISMYDYLSKDKKIHPIFLDYSRFHNYVLEFSQIQTPGLLSNYQYLNH